MTIVRELVTKLSFQVDRRGIENFNRSIIGFKSKFAIATTAVAGFVAGVVKSVSSVADAVIDTNELAKTIGVATDELVALQKTGKQFRMPEDQFSAGLKKLSDEVREARNGFGKLQQLARDGVFEIRGENKQLLETEQILFNIIEALAKVENNVDRRDLAKQIFGNERFANLADANIEKIKQFIEQFRPLGEEIAKADAQAIRFDSSLTRLLDGAKGFAFQFFPPVFDFFSSAFEEIEGEIKSFQKGTFLEDLFKKIGNEAAAFDRSLGFKNNFGLEPASNTKQVNVNNTITVTVPPGTEESQAQFIKQSMEEAADRSFEDKFEEIGNNFPETE